MFKGSENNTHLLLQIARLTYHTLIRVWFSHRLDVDKPLWVLMVGNDVYGKLCFASMFPEITFLGSHVPQVSRFQ